jgi:hypothetical protein
MTHANTKTAFRNRAKALFKSVFNVPYATNSLIKKHFHSFTNTSEGWADLVDALVERSTANDEEIVNRAYGLTTTGNSDNLSVSILGVFDKVRGTRKDIWLGLALYTFWSKSWSFSYDRFNRQSHSANSYEECVKALLRKHNYEQSIRASILA